jgi:[acyl-carrier-protein] S-malonyltransferase
VSARTALVFPGQGSQRPGMLDAVPELDSLDRLLDAAEALSGLELRGLVEIGPAEKLADTRVAQPLLYLADWAWGLTLIESCIEPFAVAGHSLGELAALAVAGVFSVEAGLELVVERSKLMAAAAQSRPGAMTAVLGMDRAGVAVAIDGLDDVWLANDNSTGQVVISGTADAVKTASARLAEAGARRVVALAVSGAFHTPMMESAGLAFADLLLGAAFDDARIPVYQNTDPTPQTDGDAIRERLIGQITSPVRWTETMDALVADGPVTVVECGPGSVLADLARRIDGVAAYSVETASLEMIVEEALR